MSEPSFEQLGALIDALYNLRAKRLEMAKQVDALKAEEETQRIQLLEMLQKYGLAKASGAIATIGQTHKIEPLVTEWEDVWKFIREENRFDLLQKRLSAPAWRELNEGGILVPGTMPQDVWDISLTKSTRG